MFIIVTRNGDTRRLMIPDAIERAGKAAEYAAKPPADAWADAERVTASWPHPDAPIAPLSPITPVASTDDEG